MKIESLKDLQKIIALCYKQGVTSIKLGDLELTLGPKPVTKTQKPMDFSSDFPEASIAVPQYSPITGEEIKAVADKIATDELTEDQLLFYSAQGHVEQ